MSEKKKPSSDQVMIFTYPTDINLNKKLGEKDTKILLGELNDKILKIKDSQEKDKYFTPEQLILSKVIKDIKDNNKLTIRGVYNMISNVRFTEEDIATLAKDIKAKKIAFQDKKFESLVARVDQSKAENLKSGRLLSKEVKSDLNIFRNIVEQDIAFRNNLTTEEDACYISYVQFEADYEKENGIELDSALAKGFEVDYQKKAKDAAKQILTKVIKDKDLDKKTNFLSNFF